MAARKASCSCGQLTLTCDGPDPERRLLCHCKNCQLQTGSAFAIQARFPRDQIAIEGIVMGMLKPLGIEKGKEFKPDARQRKILEEAAQMGDAMGRVMPFDGPDRFHQVGEGLGVEPFPGTKWQWEFQVNPVQHTDTYGRIYYPKAGLFDGTWKLPDVEWVK